MTEVQVVAARVEAEEFDVEHVREPRQRKLEGRYAAMVSRTRIAGSAATVRKEAGVLPGVAAVRQ